MQEQPKRFTGLYLQDNARIWPDCLTCAISQGQNLDLTVLHVPCLLERERERERVSERKRERERERDGDGVWAGFG